MNKLLAAMLVTVLPGLALAGGETNMAVQTLKPVISIIDLTTEQAQILQKVHVDYQVQKAVLDAAYDAKVNALIEVKAASISIEHGNDKANSNS